jgi:hypothetical protein
MSEEALNAGPNHPAIAVLDVLRALRATTHSPPTVGAAEFALLDEFDPCECQSGLLLVVLAVDADAVLVE